MRKLCNDMDNNNFKKLLDKFSSTILATEMSQIVQSNIFNDLIANKFITNLTSQIG